MVLEPYVLAVDPGRDKTGIAILTRTSQLMMMDIVPTDSVMCELQSLLRMYAGVSVLVCGNGTNHKAVGTMVKLLPICIYPTYKNGRLINITSTLNDIPDSLLAIKAIPTTPPSIRWFGTKNTSSP